MPSLAAKIRNLGQFGILTDPDPYDLPPQAFSAGVNVRFVNGRLERGPAFRLAGPAAHGTPRFLTSYRPDGLSDSIFVGYTSGRVFKWSTGSEADFSIPGYIDTANPSAFTSTRLAGVLYVNRSDREPWSLKSDATHFETLANWSPDWRCKLLRSFNSSLVALNVTKAGVSYPTMVKTSDFALADSVPATWDESDETNNAYENILAEMDGEIVDAHSLGEAFFIYSTKETWVMQATGDTQLYAVTRKWNDAGAIAANCVVEIDSKHYVFGTDDIWIHDGIGRKSIADGRVRRFIYKSLNVSRASEAFVVHDPRLKEIAFCFVSSDRLTAFPQANASLGCNRAAVYQYVEDKWTFYDLPYTVAADVTNVAPVETWDSSTGQWDLDSNPWQDETYELQKGAVYLGNASADGALASSVYACDLYGPEATFGSFAVSTAASPMAYVERDGIDLDEVGADLTGYKTVLAVYPQARLDKTGASLEFSFGSADDFNEDPAFEDYVTYDGQALRKCDYRSAGRYLSMRMRYNDYKTMSLSGLDLDLAVTSRR